MFDKKILEEVLATAMASGADFAEIYGERTRNNSIKFLDGKIERISDNFLSGVGIRAFLGTRTIYASTTDISREGLLRCARSVSDAMGEGTAQISVVLTPQSVLDVHPIKINPASAETRVKTDILKEACFAAKEHDEHISQVQGTLADVDHSILVANSDGLLVEDRHIRTRIAVNAVASDGEQNQSGFYGPGASMGLELFERVDPREVGVHAAKQAMVNLGAGYCQAGQMTVAIENGFGGVIFHEACGHSLEATQVGVGMSEMCGKLGQKIANEKITAIDDGTIPNAWGSVNIDDEGNPTRRNVLIERGVLKNYMIDRLGSRRMGMPMTGNRLFLRIRPVSSTAKRSLPNT